MKVRTDQQQLIFDRHLKQWLIAAVAILTIGIACFGYTWHKDSKANQYYQAKITRIRTDQQQLLSYTKKPRYVVNSQGHMDYGAQATIKRIRSVLARVTSYTSGRSYAAGVNASKSYIKDPTIYKTLFTPNINKFGNSIIDQESLKSSYSSANVFEMFPGQYLVVLNYYMYKNPRSQLHTDDMKPTTVIIEMDGDQYSISHAKYLKSISTPQGQQS